MVALVLAAELEETRRRWAGSIAELTEVRRVCQLVSADRDTVRAERDAAQAELAAQRETLGEEITSCRTRREQTQLALERSQSETVAMTAEVAAMTEAAATREVMIVQMGGEVEGLREDSDRWRPD